MVSDHNQPTPDGEGGNRRRDRDERDQIPHVHPPTSGVWTVFLRSSGEPPVLARRESWREQSVLPGPPVRTLNCR
jgi:hypothetical protein